MKKKILLFISVIALLTVVLAGCISKPPHKILSDPWLSTETITYEVTRTLKGADPIKGTSTITTERLTNNSDKKVGDTPLNNFSGTFVTMSTVLDDGSAMIAQVAFESNFAPVASYKKIDIKGHEGNSPSKDTSQITNISYHDEKCFYSTNYDGVENSDEIKTGEWIKKPYYDNLMLYHIARSSYLDNKFSSIQTKVLSTSDFEFKTMTVSLTESNSVYKLFGEEEDGIKTDVVSITLNQTFPGSGTPLTVRLSREINANYQGLNLSTDRIPLVITEGDMIYKIKSYSATK